jgi:hypothetical protein
VAGKAPKVLLKPVSSTEKIIAHKETKTSVSVETGDFIGDVRVDNMNFARAAVTLIDPAYGKCRIKARIHMTMADPIGEVKDIVMPLKRARKDGLKVGEMCHSQKITKYHPFHTWKIGSIIRNVKCIFSTIRDGVMYLELTNRSQCDTSVVNKGLIQPDPSPLFVESTSDLKPGMMVRCIITNISKSNKGVWVQICPGIIGFLSGLDLSDDVRVLNDLSNYFKIGGRVDAWVISNKLESSDQEKDVIRLSLRGSSGNSDMSLPCKPSRGDLTVGRINRLAFVQRPPALMLELPGGYIGRVDVTELDDIEKWANMPLGRSSTSEKSASKSVDNVENSNLGHREISRKEPLCDTFDDDDSDGR